MNMRPINGGPGIEIDTTRNASRILTLRRELQRLKGEMVSAGDAVVACRMTGASMDDHNGKWLAFGAAERAVNVAARKLADAEREAVAAPWAFDLVAG